MDNTSPVRGPVGAFCGVGAWYGLAALYNATTQSSYLVQYGNWVPAEETSPAGGAHQFIPAWDGSLCDLPGKRVTALQVTTHDSVVGAPPTGGNPLLLVGFSDGTYGWLRLPRDGPSPFTPDAHLAPADFTDQPAFLRHPRHSLMAPCDVKAYLSFAATGPVLDDARYVTVEYRVDPVGREDPWTALPGRLTQRGARVLFPEDTTGRIIDVRERFRAQRPGATAGTSRGRTSTRCPPRWWPRSPCASSCARPSDSSTRSRCSPTTGWPAGTARPTARRRSRSATCWWPRRRTRGTSS